MLADLRIVEGVARITDGGARQVCSLQLQVIVNVHVVTHMAQREPAAHGDLRRACGIGRGHGKAAQGFAQVLDHLFSTGHAGGVDDEPAVVAIDPGMDDATLHQRPGAQLFGNPQLQIAHLLAAYGKSLLGGDVHRLIGRFLADHRAGQELLFYAQCDELVRADAVQEAGGGSNWHPAAGRQVEMAAGLQRTAFQPGLQISGRKIEFRRQAIDAEIPEEHDARAISKAAQYSDARRIWNAD